MQNRPTLYLVCVLLLTACDPSLLQSPGAVGGVGAVSGAVVTKVVKDIEEISKLPPKLNLRPIEVCRKDPEVEGFVKCILTPCETSCKKYIRLSTIDLDTVVLIKAEGWKRLAAEIKALCFSPEPEFRAVCNRQIKNYSNVDKIFILP